MLIILYLQIIDIINMEETWKEGREMGINDSIEVNLRKEIGDIIKHIDRICANNSTLKIKPLWHA
jgi:hypothetical protein